jgi:hypothetical protein
MIPIHDAFINSSKERLYLFSLSAISSGAEACKVSATDESNEICELIFSIWYNRWSSFFVYLSRERLG